jgi:hypothetical protein
VRRALRLTVIGGVLLAIYSLINHHPLRSPILVSMPDVVPFIPVLAPAYLAMLLIGWYLPLAIRSDDRFAACVRTCIWAFVITTVLWITMPTTMPRPMVSADWWNAPYRFLNAVDAPTNICPCGHILAPVIGVWFLSQERPRWLPIMIAALIAGAVIIAVTWQHRPIDILIGTAIASVAIALDRRAERIRQPFH